MKKTDNTPDANENTKTPNTASKKKKKRKWLRVTALVLVFCMAVFGAVIISDAFFGDSDGSTAPEIIAITVSGKTIIISEDKEVTLAELEDYLRKLDEAGDLTTVALINDTANPADREVYNCVVSLLAEFGIECATMPYSAASFDESSATPDQA
ncbi:MAG: hypothetical protein ACI4GZ_06810 [Ruminococcus sp.]